MALLVYWYDFICFAIVAVAVSGSLWVLHGSEHRRRPRQESVYESLVIVNGGDGDQMRHSQLWMSCWAGLHPFWLLAFRSVSAVSMAVMLWWDVYSYGFYIMLYYTEWTFMLVIVYFVLATTISAHGCLLYSKQHAFISEERHEYIRRDIEESNPEAETCRTDVDKDSAKWQGQRKQGDIEQRVGFWGYAMQIIYQTCAGAVLLTDIVFWCVIVPFLSNGHLRLSMFMGCMHSLNLVFLLIDTALNNLQFPWFRMAYFIIWSCTYVILQWILHACGLSWWPYPFLELDTPWAPLWYFVMALIHIPCYGLYALVVKAKNMLFSRWFPHAFIK